MQSKVKSLQINLIKVSLFALLSIGLVLSLMQNDAHANPVTTANVHTPQNPCALFYSKQKNKRFDVVDLSILRANQGRVEVMILGLPKKVSANINGIDVSRNVANVKQIQCGREAVGEFRLYDLSKLKNMDAGYFQINADNLQAGTSINLK